jgi:ribonuclease J
VDAPAHRDPAHGEALHLAEHANFARAQGVPRCEGQERAVVRLAPGKAENHRRRAVGPPLQGRRHRHPATDRAVPERRKLAFAGIISVAIAIDKRGEIAGDPVIDVMGLPSRTRRGEDTADLIADAVGQVLDSLPKPKRRDPEAVENSVERAIRGTVNQFWARSPPATCSWSRSEAQGDLA